MQPLKALGQIKSPVLSGLGAAHYPALLKDWNPTGNSGDLNSGPLDCEARGKTTAPCHTGNLLYCYIKMATLEN